MSLTDFLKMLKEKWYLLVLFPVVFALAAAGYCWTFMADVYTSSVTLYVLNSGTQSTTTDGSGTTSASSSSSKTYDFNQGSTVAGDVLALAQSSKVSSAVAQASGLNSLSGYSVATSAGKSARVILLSVTGPNPEVAAIIANNEATQLTLLAGTLMGMEGMNVIDSASVPTTPSGPNRLKYVGIAFIVGLCAALALIVLLDLLNLTVRSDEEAEKEFGLPVLGRVPYVKRLK